MRLIAKSGCNCTRLRFQALARLALLARVHTRRRPVGTRSIWAALLRTGARQGQRRAATAAGLGDRPVLVSLLPCRRVARDVHPRENAAAG